MMKKIIVEDGKGKALLLFHDDSFIKNEEDIYYEDRVEDFSDNDEISLEEEGFMCGYLAA